MIYEYVRCVYDQEIRDRSPGTKLRIETRSTFSHFPSNILGNIWIIDIRNMSQ